MRDALREMAVAARRTAGRLARGRTEAAVTYQPDVRERDAETLLARAAGAVHRHRGPLTVRVADADRLADLRGVGEPFAP